MLFLNCCFIDHWLPYYLLTGLLITDQFIINQLKLLIQAQNSLPTWSIH